MSDENGEQAPSQQAEVPKPRRVILEYHGDDLQIAAEQCSPALVEATLLRGLAVIQREILIMRLNEEGQRQAKLASDAAALRSRIERGR